MCHLILSTNEPILININKEFIKNSSKKKLLRVNLNNRVGFDTHVTNIFNRMNKKNCML